jgi:hypothetical protein
MRAVTSAALASVWRRAGWEAFGIAHPSAKSRRVDIAAGCNSPRISSSDGARRNGVNRAMPGSSGYSTIIFTTIEDATRSPM